MHVNGDGYDRQGIRQSAGKPAGLGAKVAAALLVLALSIPIVLAWVGLVRFLIEWAL